MVRFEFMRCGGKLSGKGIRMRKMVLIFAVMAMVGIAKAELIYNGDFELSAGWGAAPDGWVKDFNSHGAHNISFSAGAWSLHPGSGSAPGGSYQDITTEPGRWYDLSLWSMNWDFLPGTSNVKVLVGEPGTDTYYFENGIISTSSYSLDGLVMKNLPTAIDGSWSQSGFRFEAIGETTRIGIYLAPLAGQDGHSVNVDIVSVVPAAIIPARNLIVDPVNGDGTVGVLVGPDVELTLNWQAGYDPNQIDEINSQILTHYVFISEDQNVEGDPELYYIGKVDQAGDNWDHSFGPITLNNNGVYNWTVEEGLDDGTGNAYPPGDPNNIPGEIRTFRTKAANVSIVDDPVNDLADPDASFSVTALMVGSYQWYKVGDPDIALSDDGTYSGTQAATLIVTGATFAEEGRYYCVVSNSAPSEVISGSALLWTKRLMGHWKFDGDLSDSVTEAVPGAPAHDGTIAVNQTVIGVDISDPVWGGFNDNNFIDFEVPGVLPAKSTLGLDIPGAEVELAVNNWWSNYDGHDNGGLEFPFNYSNVDDWGGSGIAGESIIITFSGLNENLTYDFAFHAGWPLDDFAIQATSNDGKLSEVVNTGPTGAPNIGRIYGATTDPNGLLEFNLISTIGGIPLMNAAALMFTESAVGPVFASDVADEAMDGDAIKFDNVNEYVEISDSDYFNFYQQGFTASAWYKEDAGVGWRLPISKVSNDPLAGWYFMIDSPDDSRGYVISEPGYIWVGTDPDVAFNDGQWHLITATYDPADTTMRLYTDGEYSGQVPIDLSTLPLTGAPLSIGGRYGESSISGGIDDVRIYSYPLSAVEVASLYTEFNPGVELCLATDEAFLNVDLNNDCRINIEDMAMLAARWLQCQLVPVEACN